VHRSRGPRTAACVAVGRRLPWGGQLRERHHGSNASPSRFLAHLAPSLGSSCVVALDRGGRQGLAADRDVLEVAGAEERAGARDMK
jgi:hypothetical protein